MFVLGASKVKDQPCARREQYNADSGVSRRDVERCHYALDEVETSPEVSSTIGLNTSRTVKEESQVETFAAH